ncbi:Ig-like domain repeat protein (plasmid) [Methanosphaera sp. ISO3-F5]|uniref:Ig-like domain-containing protein n=1 Tax=Methanosphaera sp. ISO3-F5 TaxID=1452353 RepID=UPI002B257864|nr:Ig-like domain repeat protein [Methanosphaera sp. ISO3-F5]WQH65426.1 hypothetical protein PXD04_11125 [Methanosphaera sp. ISO3-F5]
MNNGILSLTNSTLTYNKATDAGGSIYINYDLKYDDLEDVKLTYINNNNFNRNNAREGSAIFINEITRIWDEEEYRNNTDITITHITNNIFKQNKAKTTGSAIINRGKNTKLINNKNMKKSPDYSTIHIIEGTNTLIKSNIFDMTKIPTKITINNIKQKTYKQKITITGKLTDDTATILKNTNIKIKHNNKTYTVKTNNKGIYTLKITANKAGTNKVTATFKGNKYYKTITKKTTYKTVARPTKITVNKISTTTYGKRIKITGKLTDNQGIILKNSKIKIKINTITVNTKTNNRGVYTYTYKTNKKGTNTITVSYPKTTNYKSSTAKTTFKVK